MNTTFKLNNILAVLLFLSATLLSKSCGSTTLRSSADELFLITDGASVSYDLKKPHEKHFLPYVLSEISGLSYSPNGTLLAIDDEKGKVFQYDPASRELVGSMIFSDHGDYEGLELVNDTIYVLESDGDIYSFRNGESGKSKSKKYETKLSRENDTEGLGYDPISNSFLIACKEKGEVNGNKARSRSIYSFDLGNMELSKLPIFSITPKMLKTFWENRKDRTYEADKIKFKPSAIAFHPIEKNYYVLSSVGKLLVVVSRNGEIEATYPISPGILAQPEGLCFSPSGDMFISSEGQDDRGYILKFLMNKK